MAHVVPQRGRLAAPAAVLVLTLLSMAGASQAAEAVTASSADFGVDAAGVRAARAAVARRTTIGSGPAAASWPREAVAGSLLVTVDDGAAQALAGAVRDGRIGLRSAAARPLSSAVVQLRVPAGTEAVAARALARRGDVIAVEPDLRLHFSRVPNDPGYPQQFAHQLANAEAAWDTTVGDPALRVAVLDSGIVADHPDLAGLVVDQRNATGGQVVAGQRDNDVCQYGHGTWVAGVIGALGDNGMDVVGATYGIQFVDINISETTPEGCRSGAITLANLIAGLDYATAQGVDLVNLSLGSVARACPTALQTSLDAAGAAGIAVVAASGNAGPGTIGIPASCAGVIAVGAVGPDATTAPYSSSNAQVDLTAAGGNDLNDDTNLAADEGVVTTSWYQVGERTASTLPVAGTSFSAPYVTGVAALLLSVDGDLTPDQVEGLLEASAQDLGPPGRDDDTGWGLVDAGAAVDLAGSGARPAPAADPAFPVGTQVGIRPGGDIDVLRVGTGTGTTDAVGESVAISDALFPPVTDGQGFAEFAVLARADDFADALAGSSLTLGAGPLLFSGRDALAPQVGAEFQRVLTPGSTVFILGGPAALSPAVEDGIRALGFEPFRIAGPAREETAVAVAQVLGELLTQVQLPPSPAVILASRSVWYDAITAGSLAAGLTSPVLLTSADSLHPATAAALRTSTAELLYIVGGEVRVSDATRAQAIRLAEPAQTTVLAGDTRDGTAIAVATEVETILDGLGGFPQVAVAINLTRPDGYAPALSISPFLATVPSLFLPVLGDNGDQYTPVVSDYAGGLGLDALILGDTDFISAQSQAALERLLETPAQ